MTKAKLTPDTTSTTSKIDIKEVPATPTIEVKAETAAPTIEVKEERRLSKAIPKEIKDPEYTSKRVAEIRAKRAERGTISGPSLRLGIPEELKDPNWAYRWGNDSDMRIHNLLERDWEFAGSELDTSGKNEAMGSRVERTVNERSTTGPQKGFLMKKPKEIFDEDQAAKETRRRQLEKGMEKGKNSSPEGLTGPLSYVVPGTKL